MPVLIPDGWSNFDGGAVSCDPISVEASGDIDCLLGPECVTLTAAGGVAPYSWSTTKGAITPAVDTLTAELCPPTNSGSGLGGGAYQIVSVFKGSSCFHYYTLEVFDCAGVGGGCSGVGGSECGHGAPGANSASFCASGSTCEGTGSCTGLPTYNPYCAGLYATRQWMCDRRSAAQISGGCSPCRISMDGGAVVTVEDSLGNTAFVAVGVS